MLQEQSERLSTIVKINEEILSGAKNYVQLGKAIIAINSINDALPTAFEKQMSFNTEMTDENAKSFLDSAEPIVSLFFDIKPNTFFQNLL